MSTLARTRVELAQALQGGRPRVLVPTMGALHDGHRALARRARAVADPDGLVVVSVFVNPLQFGSAQDLAGYPRTLDQDLVVCADEGVDVVWAPSVDVMYPRGTPAVSVSSGLLGTVLEGASRPGHFDGVLTVVTKLLGQVRPDVAVFGAKDAQQVWLVRRLILDLDLPVALETVDTVRAADGLALSSRNGRLTEKGRQTATALPRALSAAAAAAPVGASSATVAARAVLDAEPGLVLDYLALVEPETFADVGPGYVGPAVVVVAGTVEGVRLIDNVTVTCG